MMSRRGFLGSAAVLAGASAVAPITLALAKGMTLRQIVDLYLREGRTIFLAPATRLEPELLLHEFRHVQQFSEVRTFPFRYIWESLRRGYHANRYEADARSYAARRLSRTTGTGPDEDA